MLHPVAWGQGGRVTWGGQTFDQEIFADLLGKKRQGKNGKEGKGEEKKRRKIVKRSKKEVGKLKMELGKVTK